MTPTEREQLTQIYDRLLELYVEGEVAVAEGDSPRAAQLRRSIDALMREKAEIKRWMPAGSA